MNVRTLLAVAVATSALAVSAPGAAFAGDSTVRAESRGWDNDVEIAVRGRGTAVDSSAVGIGLRQRLQVLADGAEVQVRQHGSGGNVDAVFLGHGRKTHLYAGGCADEGRLVFDDNSRAVHVVKQGRCR